MTARQVLKGWMVGGLMGLGICTGLGHGLPAYHPVLNVGQSLPGTLYVCRGLTPREPLQRGMVVFYVPPARVQTLVRRLAPDADLRLPWLKKVGAIAGDEVCWRLADLAVNQVSVGGLPLVSRYVLDVPETCQTLATEEVLPLGTAPNSFDGRYTGPLTRKEITGVCTVLF